MFTKYTHRVYNQLMDHLNRLISRYKTKAALARALGVSPMTVRQWEVRGQVSVDGAKAIEALTDGEYTREQLRPDVFNKAVA